MCRLFILIAFFFSAISLILVQAPSVHAQEECLGQIILKKGGEERILDAFKGTGFAVLPRNARKEARSRLVNCAEKAYETRWSHIVPDECRTGFIDGYEIVSLKNEIEREICWWVASDNFALRKNNMPKGTYEVRFRTSGKRGCDSDRKLMNYDITLAMCQRVTAWIPGDRPGSDIMNFPIRQQDPGACAEACSKNPRCKAWTYVKDSHTNLQDRAHCWLKDSIPRLRGGGDCCVSGIKGAVEGYTDRPGGDYRKFEAKDPAECHEACAKDQRCQSWTHVGAHVGGDQNRPATCWLKDRTPRVRFYPNMTSGVKR